MAYAFNRVDNLLNRRRREDGVDAEAATTRNIAPGARSISGSTGGSGPLGDKAPGAKFSRVGAATRARKAFSGKTKLPGFLGDLKGDVEERKRGIIEGAKEYLDKQKAETEKQFGVSDDQTRSALESDGDDFNRVRRVLSSSPRSIESKDFKSPVIPDLQSLKSDTGLKRLYRKGRGPRYTPGMAEFDVGLAKETPGFTRKVSGLVKGQKDLHELAKKEYGAAWEDATSHDRKSLEDVQKRLEDYISGQGESLRGAQKEEAEALTKKLAEMRSRRYRRGEFDDAYEDYLKEALGDAYIGLRQHLREGYPIDAAYDAKIKRATKDYRDIAGFDPRDMYTPEEAAKYNRIMSLLGVDDTRSGQDPIDLDIETMTPEEIKNIAYPQMARRRDEILETHAGRSEALGSIDPNLNLSYTPDARDSLAHVFEEYEGLEGLRDPLADAYASDEKFRKMLDEQLEEHDLKRHMRYPNNPERSIRSMSKRGMAEILAHRLDSMRDPSFGIPRHESKELLTHFKESNLRHVLTPSERQSLNALVDIVGGERRPQSTNDILRVDKLQPKLIKVLTHRG